MMLMAVPVVSNIDPVQLLGLLQSQFCLLPLRDVPDVDYIGTLTLVGGKGTGEFDGHFGAVLANYCTSQTARARVYPTSSADVLL